MPARMKPELAIGRQVDVTRRRRIPNARAVAKRHRPLEFGESEGVSVELSSAGFLARRIEHLGVMQGNPHKIESRRAKIQCFWCVSWAIIQSVTRTEVLTWRSSRTRRQPRPHESFPPHSYHSRQKRRTSYARFSRSRTGKTSRCACTSHRVDARASRMG